MFGKGVMRMQHITKWCTVRKLSNKNHGGDRTGLFRTSWTDKKAARVGGTYFGKSRRYNSTFIGRTGVKWKDLLLMIANKKARFLLKRNNQTCAKTEQIHHNSQGMLWK